MRRIIPILLCTIGLAPFSSKAQEVQRLSLQDCIDYAVKNSDIAIICVGTPSSEDGRLNFDYLYNVAAQIGKALRNKNDFF